MEQTISLREQFRRSPRITLSCHKSTIHAVKWSPDGNRLASVGKDETVHFHRVTESDLTWEHRFSTQSHQGDIENLSWNPMNPNLLATASMDKHVKIWDVRSIDPVDSIRLRNENITVCWSPNGQTIGVADRADTITLLDTRNSHPYQALKAHKFNFEVGEICWNNENDLFFITSGDGKIHVLSFPDFQTQLVIDAFASPCVCIRFSPNGQYFAVGSNDALTSIWDHENLACCNVIDRLEWPTKTVSFSHDGKYLASGSEDHIIDIADVSTGQQVDFVDVSSPTLTLDFHPKEYILAYALEESDFRDRTIPRDGTIKVIGFPEKDRNRRQHN